MRRLTLLVGLLLAVLAGVCLAGASSSASSGKAQWVITDLGTLGGRFSEATAVNGRGQVVGTSRTASGERRVFLWQDGRMIDIGRYGWNVGSRPLVLLNERGQVAWNEQGRGAVVWESGRTRLIGKGAIVGMNDRGQIVGYSTTIKNGMVWQNGTVRDLGSLAGFEYSKPEAINERGQVVGSGWHNPADENAPIITHAFLWQNGKLRDLGVLPGYQESTAIAANERGQVLGSCDTDTRWTAFLWENGTRNLDTLRRGPLAPVALNDSGQVIVDTQARGREHAFLWENGQMRDLGATGYNSEAHLNAHGQVAMTSYTPSGNQHAFVWKDRTKTDIAEGRWSSVTDINDQGQIVGARGAGQSYKGSRVVHAVLWTLKTGG